MNKQVTLSRASRRQFIKYGSMAAGGVALTGPYPVRGQNLNSKLNLAQIGCGGKGRSDVRIVRPAGENVVALCDVNTPSGRTMKQIPARQSATDANFYKDYRELFDKEKSIDAVDVATPDHMHAVIAATAIKMGKHVYCQKPLTHDVFEARTLRELARQHNVATQMGNQGSASDSLRRAVEVMQAGIIGPVHQAYVWTNRPIWPQGHGSSVRAAIRCRRTWIGTFGSAPRRSVLSKLDWPGRTSRASDSPGCLSAVCLARLAGFRHRRAGRHGLPHRQLALPLAQAGLSDRDRSQFLGHEHRDVPDQFEHPLRVSRPRRDARGDAALVRRRQQAARRNSRPMSKP